MPVHKPEYYKALHTLEKAYKRHKDKSLHDWFKFKLAINKHFWVGGGRTKLVKQLDLVVGMDTRPRVNSNRPSIRGN